MLLKEPRCTTDIRSGTSTSMTTASRARRITGAVCLLLTICGCWWLAITPLGARGNGNQIPAPSQGQGSVLSGSCFVSRCHATSGSTIDQVGSLSLDGLPDAFEPGQTYDFTVNMTGGSVYGVQIAVTYPNGSPAGSLTPITPGLRNNQLDGIPVVNHSPTPLATGTVNLQWTAPAEPEVPNVLFRVASNSANGNDSATGDHIHRLQLTLPQTIECTYSLTSETDSFDSEGGNGSASVIAPEGCGWTATSSDDWITLSEAPSGSGDGTINFTVEANTSSLPRSGAIMVEDQVLDITQTGVDCSYSLSSDGASFDSDGGEGSVDVVSPEGCDWTATANDNWISVTGQAGGSGSGPVTFTVDPNISALPRSGSITVEDQILPISQTGVECSYSLSRNTVSFDSDEASSSVDVAAPEGCEWLASASDSWITITGGASGSGNGEVVFSVDANPASEARSGSITVDNQMLAISQTGQQMADLIFPQFLNGEINGVLNATRVILSNGGAEVASGQIRFRESSSLFAAVPVNGQMTDTVEFAIEPRGTFEIETDGTGTLQTGVVEVFVEGATDSVQGTEIFSVLGNFVSVPAGRRDLAPQSYISVNLKESSGIAAYNPDGSNAALVDVTLLDASGIERSMGQFALQPNEQLARFVDEPGGLFPDFFAANPDPFTGTLNFNVVEGDEGIVVLGLIQRRAGGQLIAVGTGSQGPVPLEPLATPSADMPLDFLGTHAGADPTGGVKAFP